ncbi:hypothetical protein SDC9_184791 [bioreactor metagenome]|uniref:Uncharacterized protein n=1 Tax=bioreactor metagenome TaxID=1076179 RepID=A0A645HE10_9ZZZZ
MIKYFLPQLNGRDIHGLVQESQIRLFGVNQKINPIECHPAIIANDPATAISIRQPGYYPQPAGNFHFGRIDGKYPVIMGTAVNGEEFA